MAPAQTPLLDKLGGVKAVRLVVDEFYAKVLADERINGFFKNTSMAKLKQHQVDFMTFAFGGPEQYRGRSILEAHKPMVERSGLRGAHFDVVCGHLVATLQQVGVAEALIGEVAEKLIPLRSCFDYRDAEVATPEKLLA